VFWIQRQYYASAALAEGKKMDRATSCVLLQAFAAPVAYRRYSSKAKHRTGVNFGWTAICLVDGHRGRRKARSEQGTKNNSVPDFRIRVITRACPVSQQWRKGGSLENVLRAD